MQLSIAFVFLIFCITLTLTAEDDVVDRERKMWKILEEILDIIGVKPNPIPELAEKMLKKRCLISGLICTSLVATANMISSIATNTGVIFSAAAAVPAAMVAKAAKSTAGVFSYVANSASAAADKWYSHSMQNYYDSSSAYLRV